MENPKVNESVMELLELSNYNSPFTPELLARYRRKLVKRLLRNGKIDQQTADYLFN